MHDAFESAVRELQNKLYVDSNTLERFIKQLNSATSKTRDTGIKDHFCSMIVPVHKPSRSIYLVDHIKGKTWMVPGGHIDKDESPEDTAIREFSEELNYSIKDETMYVFNASVSPIHDKIRPCNIHFDYWYIVEMSHKEQFRFSTREFNTAGWFTVDEAKEKVIYPSYVKIIKDISELL